MWSSLYGCALKGQQLDKTPSLPSDTFQYHLDNREPIYDFGPPSTIEKFC